MSEQIDDYEKIDGEFEQLGYRQTFASSPDPLNGRYSYVSYITADADNDTHSYDEIVRGSSNRWSYQSYYTTPPEQRRCDGSGCLRTAHTNMNFRVKAADSPFEQTNIDFTSFYPQDETELNAFGIGIGAGFGPVSGSVSVSQSLDGSDVDVNHEHYHFVEWDLTIGNSWAGNWSGDPPDNQENNVGVHFDVDANENLQEETITANVNMEWMVYRTHNRGSDRLYVEEDNHIADPSFTTEIEVVRPD